MSCAVSRISGTPSTAEMPGSATGSTFGAARTTISGP